MQLRRPSAQHSDEGIMHCLKKSRVQAASKLPLPACLLLVLQALPDQLEELEALETQYAARLAPLEQRRQAIERAAHRCASLRHAVMHNSTAGRIAAYHVEGLWQGCINELVFRSCKYS